jgi:AbrB family looped-hinge helix DNA binding protein
MKSAPDLATVQFTAEGRGVIPARFRRAFQIEEGTRASVIATSDGILIRPIARAYIKRLHGSLKGVA